MAGTTWPDQANERCPDCKELELPDPPEFTPELLKQMHDEGLAFSKEIEKKFKAMSRPLTLHELESRLTRVEKMLEALQTMLEKDV